MLYKFKLLFAIAMILSSIIPDDLLAQTESGFMVVDIDQKLEDEMRAKNVFGEHSPIPLERLKLVYIKHIDFNGYEQSGEIIVLDACAEQVKQLFIELYEAKFPMTQVRLITEYNGSDSLSMAENNTSSHNLRQVTGGKRLSLHAYGTAIDINPINNPYID
ncbi:MAG: M15 family metallopeptidase, partial [bacterium]|nr:M15 family metallopeptidase [bacterium]